MAVIYAQSDGDSSFAVAKETYSLKLKGLADTCRRFVSILCSGNFHSADRRERDVGFPCQL